MSRGIAAKPRRVGTSRDPKDRLASLGLAPLHIEGLLALVPTFRAMGMKRAPTMDRQRTALDDIEKALRAAEKACSRAWNLTDAEGLGLALRARLDAYAGAERSRDVIDRFAESLVELRQLVAAARHAMPRTGQTRQRAPTLPIKLILRQLPGATARGRIVADVAAILYEAAGVPMSEGAIDRAARNLTLDNS